MSEKGYVQCRKSVGIFQGDNIIVEDEFQPDEVKLDSDTSRELFNEYDKHEVENSEESHNQPLTYKGEVIDSNDSENNQFWFANTDADTDDPVQGGSMFLLDETSKSDNIIIEQSLTISNFDIDPVQHSKVIHINTKPDLTKPSVSGLNVARGSGSANLLVPVTKKTAMQPVYLCPDKNCKLRLPSKSILLTHVKMCHKEMLEKKTDTEADDPDGFLSDENILPDGTENENEESDFEKTDSEEINDKKVVKGKSPKSHLSKKIKLYECQYCGFVTESSAAKLKKHVKEVHEEVKQYHCTQCGIKVSRKYHLIRHIKAVHHKEKFWRCEDCDYKTNNQVCFKKHKQNKHEGGDCDSLYSVDSLQNLPKGLTEADLKCVCTWCVFKSNKYSVVKKHIEIHHERKKHYPCKECVFVGQSVDDYAEHYHTFHKTDSYPHACTDCSFKCTNKHDLKQHYSDTHSKQRLYVCKMCDHKSNDVNNMKRHINTVHNNSKKLYQCDSCNYETELKIEFLGHRYNAHGLSMASVSDDMKIILFNSQNVEGD